VLAVYHSSFLLPFQTPYCHSLLLLLIPTPFLYSLFILLIPTPPYSYSLSKLSVTDKGVQCCVGCVPLLISTPFPNSLLSLPIATPYSYSLLALPIHTPYSYSFSKLSKCHLEMFPVSQQKIFDIERSAIQLVIQKVIGHSKKVIGHWCMVILVQVPVLHLQNIVWKKTNSFYKHIVIVHLFLYL
jgi:hypothetical protein